MDQRGYEDGPPPGRQPADGAAHARIPEVSCTPPPPTPGEVDGNLPPQPERTQRRSTLGGSHRRSSSPPPHPSQFRSADWSAQNFSSSSAVMGLGAGLGPQAAAEAAWDRPKASALHDMTGLVAKEERDDEDAEGMEEDDECCCERPLMTTSSSGYIDLKLKDGFHRPFPYVLDINRIHGCTRLRYYRREAAAATPSGEVCLCGAYLSRPDPSRRLFHLRVPNFTYYLRTFSPEETALLIARIKRWVRVANTCYSSLCRAFLRVHVDVEGGADADGVVSQRRAQRMGPAHGLLDLSFALGQQQPQTWPMPAGVTRCLIEARFLADLPQTLYFRTVHAVHGPLYTPGACSLAELLGRHRSALTPLQLPLLEVSKRRRGTVTVTWEPASDRYVRLCWAGRDLWRKDFVRADPFFRVRIAPTPVPLPPPRDGPVEAASRSPRGAAQRGSVPRASLAASPRRHSVSPYVMHQTPGSVSRRRGEPLMPQRDNDTPAPPVAALLPGQRRGAPPLLRTAYRSEGYRNTASPDFLPMHLALPVDSGIDAPRHPDEAPPPVFVYDPAPDVEDCPDDWLALATTAAAGQTDGGLAPPPISPDLLGERQLALKRRDPDGAGGRQKNCVLRRTLDGQFVMEAAEGPLSREEADKVAAVTAASGPPPVNSNDSRWAEVRGSETLVFEVWDSNWSRTLKASLPTLIGNFETTLCSFLGLPDVQRAADGVARARVKEFKLLRSAKYDDDEPPPPEHAPDGGEVPHTPILAPRRGRGADSGNAQSTVLSTQEARYRGLQRKFALREASIHTRPSFLSFLKANWCIEAVAAVDFSLESIPAHKAPRIHGGWTALQVVMHHCLSFVLPFCGRGGADLYGFGGVLPHKEYQVFPVHSHQGGLLSTELLGEDRRPQPELPLAMSMRSDDVASSRHSSVRSRSNVALPNEADALAAPGLPWECNSPTTPPPPGHASPDSPKAAPPLDQKGVALMGSYVRAREQVHQFADGHFPVLLLPALRVATARVRAVAAERLRRCAAAQQRLRGELEAGEEDTFAADADRNNRIEALASALVQEPQHTFGVGVAFVCRAHWVADAEEVAAELKALEAAKVPFIYYLIFVDCRAPRVLSGLLNCITVDVNTHTNLQASLLLLAKGFGLLPSRVVDFMRMHGLRPEDSPDRSWIHTTLSPPEPTPRASPRRSVGRSLRGSLSRSRATGSPGAAVQGEAEEEDEEEDEEEVAEDDGDSIAEDDALDTQSDSEPSGSGPPPRARPIAPPAAACSGAGLQQLRKRQRFDQCARRFLRVFGNAEEMAANDAQAAQADTAQRFPFQDGGGDKRYRKALSTKGEQVLAVVDDESSIQGSRRQSPPRPQRGRRAAAGKGPSRFTVVDLYLTDGQLQKRDRAEQRVLDYVAEQQGHGRRRRSSGLGQQHMAFLRAKDDEQQQREQQLRMEDLVVDGADGLAGLPKKQQRSRHRAGFKGDGLTADAPPGVGNRTLSMASNDWATDDESDGEAEPSRRPSVAGNAYSRAQQLRRASRRISQSAAALAAARDASDIAQRGLPEDQQHPEQGPAAHRASEILRRALAPRPPSAAPCLPPPREVTVSNTFRPYRMHASSVRVHIKKRRRGCLRVGFAAEARLDSECKLIGRGVKVDRRLNKRKQEELRVMLCLTASVHAGPPIDPGADQDGKSPRRLRKTAKHIQAGIAMRKSINLAARQDQQRGSQGSSPGGDLAKAALRAAPPGTLPAGQPPLPAPRPSTAPHTGRPLQQRPPIATFAGAAQSVGAALSVPPSGTPSLPVRPRSAGVSRPAGTPGVSFHLGPD
eukprot:TRINITY_DN24282_c1_g3_i1.p1 TRINITY_DN24282_c1_g3~~TRINITY_DN24282_c1_g3_i1.p1  ORF type:complete len:1802 (+),score=522.33 TRINITY_DN24282_c1_g3_i1:73-5478(+)